jgi:hypothetical protein
MGRLDELGDSVRQLIRAFHGSPHADEILGKGLDPARIGASNGTGQGHGYYFSEDRSIARHYGDPVEVEIAVPRQSLGDWYAPARQQGDLLDRFASAVREAPENKWKSEAWSDLMSPDGEMQLAYQSLLRAHNVGDGGERLGRFEAGRRSSEALRKHGILGGYWEDEFASPGLKNFVLFPGIEDQIRILRQAAP